MAKELTWFKFYPSKWMMGRIQRESDEAQTLFLRLCCLYWVNECDYSVEDSKIECGEEIFETLIKKRIVKIIGDSISIEFLDEQKTDIESISDTKRGAAYARWNKEKNAGAMHVHKSECNIDKNKIREEKDKIIFSEFWELYNKKVGAKKNCEKKWNKLNVLEQQKIIDTLPSWKKQFSDKQYQPFPETYLNQERWNDEIIKPNNSDIYKNAF